MPGKFRPKCDLLPTAKMTSVNVKVTGENGSVYDAEMQVAPSKYFAERMLYYRARIYASQIGG